MLHLHGGPEDDHSSILSRHSATIHIHMPDDQDFHSVHPESSEGNEPKDHPHAAQSKSVDVAAHRAPAPPTTPQPNAFVEVRSFHFGGPLAVDLPIELPVEVALSPPGLNNALTYRGPPLSA